MSKTLALDRVKQIVELHAECEGLARQTFDKAVVIGGLLAEAKADLKHGEWLPWVEANLPFTDRTARNYMRLHDRRGELKSETVSDLTGAYRMLTEPKPPRENDCLRTLQRGVEQLAQVATATDWNAYDHQELAKIATVADEARIAGTEVKLRAERGLGQTLKQLEEPDNGEAYIPPTGYHLHGNIVHRDGSSESIFIEPSAHEGYYYVSYMYSFGMDSAAYIDGTKKPIQQEYIKWGIDRFSNRTPAKNYNWHALKAEPQKYNVWLYNSHDEYIQREILGRDKLITPNG
jgi:hypothetical protein